MKTRVATKSPAASGKQKGMKGDSQTSKGGVGNCKSGSMMKK